MGEGREKERKRNIDQLLLPCPQLGTWPTTQACALTRNQTGKLSVCGTTSNPLSDTSQGSLKVSETVLPIQLFRGYLWVNYLLFWQILLSILDKIVWIYFLFPHSVQAEFTLAG